MLLARSSCRRAFFWTVMGPVAPTADVQLTGEDETQPDTHTSLRRAIDRLLTWAARDEGGMLPQHDAGNWTRVDLLYPDGYIEACSSSSNQAYFLNGYATWMIWWRKLAL